MVPPIPDLPLTRLWPGVVFSMLLAGGIVNAAPPAAPGNAAATSLAPDRARISWTDLSDNESAFVVEQGEPSSAPVVWSPVAEVAADLTSAEVGGLLPATNYSFRIVAVNADGRTPTSPLSLRTPPPGGSFLGPAHESNGIYSFAMSGPNRIERFSLASRQWLNPLPMLQPASAIWTDEIATYAAEDKLVVRWDHATSTRSIFITAGAKITSLFIAGDSLGIFYGPLEIFNRRTGAQIRSVLLYAAGLPGTGFSGPSVDPATGRVFYRPDARLHPDIFSFDTVSSAFHFWTWSNRANFRRYPAASWTRVFARGTRVMDDAGSIFSTSGLSYLNSFGPLRIDDVTFLGDTVPIVLRGAQLTAYATNMEVRGSASITAEKGLRVAISGDDALVFHADENSTRGIGFEAVPLRSLNAPAGGLPVDPKGLRFTPDNAIADRNGSIWLASGIHSSLFQWSPVSRSYTRSIPLSAIPGSMAYDPDNHRLFFTEPVNSREILSLNLNEDMPRGTPFARTASTALTFTGNHLLAAGGGDGRFFLLDRNGNQSATLSGQGIIGRHITWDPFNRRICFVAPVSSGSAISTIDITPADTFSTFRPGVIEPDNTQFFPLRLSGDGNLVATSKGVVRRTSDFRVERQLRGSVITDFIWLGNRLVTLERVSSSLSRLQRWSPAFDRERAALLPGTAHRVLALPDGGFAVITLTSAGSPAIHLLDTSFSLSHSDDPAPLSIVSPPNSLRVPFATEASFEVLALGRPPLQYQWFKEQQPIAGASGSALRIPNAGSRAAGRYHVRVSDASSHVDSPVFELAVGPVSPSPWRSRSSLLVSSTGQIREFLDDADGTLVQSIPVPPPPSTPSPDSPAVLTGVASDHMGRLHVINRVPSGSIYINHLSTYDPGMQRWIHREARDIGPSIVSAGDWLISTYGRMHSQSGTWDLFSDLYDVTTMHPAGTPDGTPITMDDDGTVRRFDPVSREWSFMARISRNAFIESFATDPDGRLYITAAGTFRSYSPDGRLLFSRAHGIASPLQNLSLGGPDGSMLAAGPIRGTSVPLAPLGLESARTITVPGPESNNPGFHVAWATPVDVVQPVFTSTPVPPATAGIAWAWQPNLSHPDPDAVLSFPTVTLPSWMRLKDGVLFGTPPAGISGLAPILLTASDASGATATLERSLTVNAPAPDGLIVSAQGIPVRNPETGLWEQRFTLTNQGPAAPHGFALTIAGLPDGATLHNASDAPNGIPRILLQQPIATGSAITLVLEYSSTSSTRPIPESVSASISPPATASSTFAIDRTEIVRPGTLALEFPSIPGSLYLVQSHDGSGDWRDAGTRIRAAGTRLQWIDRSLPTIPVPQGQGSSRFYRVKKLADR